MPRWEGKAFAYLDGMEPADDAPVMDNPGRLFCRKCRAIGTLVCDEPGFCGNLEPMKRPAEAPPAEETQVRPTKPTHTPRRGSKELRKQLQASLDDTLGRKTLEGAAQRPQSYAIPEFKERLFGNRTELKPLPDAEQSWDWFMEHVTPEGWPR
jgi:hypothetical protein